MIKEQHSIIKDLKVKTLCLKANLKASKNRLVLAYQQKEQTTEQLKTVVEVNKQLNEVVSNQTSLHYSDK